MGEGDHRDWAIDAADAARAEAEAAAEADAARAEADAAAEAELAEPGDPAPARSAGTTTCPFLRLQRDTELVPAALGPDPDHRCVALRDAVPLWDRQQSLVCLTEKHVDCPRYLRGSLRLPAGDRGRSWPSIPRATIVAAALLVASILGTLAYTASNGGLMVPIVAVPSGGATTVVSPAPSIGSGSTPSLATVPATSPSPGISTKPAPVSPSPSAVSPSPAPTSAVAHPSPSPASDRYALLVPCPARPACYVYTVRSGDNLTSIGLFFGVPFDTILRLNPWIHDPTTIHAGDRIVLPPPTR